jgi:hypothetical protein
VDCVVADAVAVEPVSTTKFPANREKNREFFNFWPYRGLEHPMRPMISMALEQIPHAIEQGIISAEQGILLQEQGSVHTTIEIIEIEAVMAKTPLRTKERGFTNTR